jgi:hypothetical protein
MKTSSKQTNSNQNNTNQNITTHTNLIQINSNQNNEELENKEEEYKVEDIAIISGNKPTLQMDRKSFNKQDYSKVMLTKNFVFSVSMKEELEKVLNDHWQFLIEVLTWKKQQHIEMAAILLWAANGKYRMSKESSSSCWKWDEELCCG